jgi:L-lactate dehydrogenase complex protein LldE
MIDLFVPCFIDSLFPNTAWNIIKTLEKAGVNVNYNPNQTCCGQPLYNSGYWNKSRKMAEKFFRDFSNNNTIIVPSASCAGFIKNHYCKLFENDPVFKDDVERVKANVIEYTDYLVNHIKFTNFNARFNHKITYHDGCSALREYGIKQEPRTLLNNVDGLELIEIKDNDTCCGFGGTFMVKFSAISSAMAEQKVNNAINTGAEFIVSSEASCLINLNSYIEQQKLQIKTMHIADVLASF